MTKKKNKKTKNKQKKKNKNRKKPKRAEIRPTNLIAQIDSAQKFGLRNNFVGEGSKPAVGEPPLSPLQ